jgi:hypothetical protein
VQRSLSVCLWHHHQGAERGGAAIQRREIWFSKRWDSELQGVEDVSNSSIAPSKNVHLELWKIAPKDKHEEEPLVTALAC